MDPIQISMDPLNSRRNALYCFILRRLLQETMATKKLRKYTNKLNIVIDQTTFQSAVVFVSIHGSSTGVTDGIVYCIRSDKLWFLWTTWHLLSLKNVEIAFPTIWTNSTQHRYWQWVALGPHIFSRTSRVLRSSKSETFCRAPREGDTHAIRWKVFLHSLGCNASHTLCQTHVAHLCHYHVLAIAM